jgi:hypothetical protein
VPTAIKYTRFARTGAPAGGAVRTAPAVAEAVLPQQTTRTPAISTDRLHPLITALIISMALPVYFSIGSLHLSPNRVLLIGAFFPATLRWLSGAAGRLRAADFWVIGLCLWGAIAMFASAGTSTIQFSGIATVETLGAYLVGRAYIRTEAQYRAVMRLLGLVILLLVPGAIIEALTGIRIYNQMFSPIFPTFPWADYEQRLHMFRAQTVFEHPILFGVFTAFCFGPIFTIIRSRAGRATAWIRTSPVIIATFFCLSMGAYLGVMTQLMMMAWGLMLRHVHNRWKILGVLSVLGYVTVDLISNRTPFQVFSSYVAFDGQTAYWRVLIFNYGMENVWEHPLFGLGAFINDWKRPEFMATSSIDNLWLVFALRYGIPGFLLILGAYLSVLVGLMRAKLTNPMLQAHRDALTFSLIGLGIAICTVHLWNATFVFMMFMLGAAAWLSDVKPDDPVSPANDETARRVSDRTGLTARQPPAR